MSSGMDEVESNTSTMAGGADGEADCTYSVIISAITDEIAVFPVPGGPRTQSAVLVSPFFQSSNPNLTVSMNLIVVLLFLSLLLSVV
jgi:hypothetical protein